MKVAVIGHTGMTGVSVVEALLSKGHDVTGLAIDAREGLNHPRFSSSKTDIFDVRDVAEKLRGHEVVVSTFSGGHQVDLAVYYRQVEGTRRVLQAVDKSGVGYLIYVGGAASLQVAPGVRMLEDPRFPTWYFGIQPAVHLRWLAEITKVPFFSEAAERKENGTIEPGQTDPWLEEKVKDWKSIPLLEGCRAALDFFHEGLSFKWSFLSPPWLYRPGEATGSYQTGIENMIFKNGVPAGISVPDMANAIADEVEKQAMVRKHWTVSEH